MSNVSGIGNTGLQNVPGLAGGDQFLSGDALIMQLEAQMTSLDGDIKSLAGMQKADLARKKALSDAYDAGMKHNPPKNQQEWDENVQGMRDAANQLPDGDPEKQIILNKVDAIEHQYCQGLASNPHYPDGDHHEWENSMQGFKDEKENLNGQAELRMISIQDLMSKRDTAVKLTEGIMSKLEASSEYICQKI
jgi:hypothetical protein